MGNLNPTITVEKDGEERVINAKYLSDWTTDGWSVRGKHAIEETESEEEEPDQSGDSDTDEGSDADSDE